MSTKKNDQINPDSSEEGADKVLPDIKTSDEKPANMLSIPSVKYNSYTGSNNKE